MRWNGLQRGADLVTEHNRLTLVVMLLLTGVVVAGIPMLDTESQASPDSASFEDLDQVQASEYIQDNYSSQQHQNTTVAKVYVRNESGNVLSKKSLLAGLHYQQSVTDNASVQAALRGDGIVGLSNLVATRAADGQDPTLEAQIQALESARPEQVEALVAETLAEDPHARQFLPADHDPQSTSAHDRRILVTLDTGTATATQASATAAIYETADAQASTEFFTLGDHARGAYNAHFVGEMVQLVLPIALLLILLVLVFAYRDPVDVVVGMTGVGLSVLWMFGIMGWLGVSAGVVSIIPVVLITGLSVDFSFHVFNRYREERADGEGIRAPMNRGVRYVATALVLVTVTAAIGFLANLANPLAIIRNLGVSITLGVVSALVLFTTVVPALKISIDGLLERIGINRSKGALGRGSYLQPALASSVTLARRAAPVVVLLAVAGAAIGGLAWTDLSQESFTGNDGEVAEWKQELPEPLGWDSHPYQARSTHVQETYQPARPGDSSRSRILITGAVTADDTLEDIHAGTGKLRDAGIVLETRRRAPIRSTVTVMRAVAQQDPTFAAAFQRADTDGDGVPDSDLASLYDAFYAANSEVASQVIERTDGEYRSLLVTVTLDSTDRGDRASYVNTLEDGAATMEGTDRDVTVAGEFAISQAILNALQSGILQTMVIALSAVVVALGVVFRLMHDSWTLGVLVGVPTVFVVGFVVGSMYLLDIPLNLLTALLMSLVIGLGIDYNIHLGDRFADELQAGKDTYGALEAAVTGTGGALLGSTLTSIGAFTTLSLVPDPGIQTFGSIVVLALGLAFLTSVFILPSLLGLWRRIAPGTLPGASGAGREEVTIPDPAISQD